MTRSISDPVNPLSGCESAGVAVRRQVISTVVSHLVVMNPPIYFCRSVPASGARNSLDLFGDLLAPWVVRYTSDSAPCPPDAKSFCICRFAEFVHARP